MSRPPYPPECVLGTDVEAAWVRHAELFGLSPTDPATLSLRDRVFLCTHREAWSVCRCDAYCDQGRGFAVTDHRDHITQRFYVNLDDCLRCLYPE